MEIFLNLNNKRKKKKEEEDIDATIIVPQLTLDLDQSAIGKPAVDKRQSALNHLFSQPPNEKKKQKAVANQYSKKQLFFQIPSQMKQQQFLDIKNGKTNISKQSENNSNLDVSKTLEQSTQDKSIVLVHQPFNQYSEFRPISNDFSSINSQINHTFNLQDNSFNMDIKKPPMPQIKIEVISENNQLETNRQTSNENQQEDNEGGFFEAVNQISSEANLYQEFDDQNYMLQTSYQQLSRTKSNISESDLRSIRSASPIYKKKTTIVDDNSPNNGFEESMDYFKICKEFFDCAQNGSQEDLLHMKNIIENNPKKYLRSTNDPDHIVNKKQAGQTPLYVASKNGNLKIVEFLLDEYADYHLPSDIKQQDQLQVFFELPILVAVR